MGLSEFFWVPSDELCTECGSECMLELHAKIPGAGMRDYQMGDRIHGEVLDALEKREQEFPRGVFESHEPTDKHGTSQHRTFTIVPNHATAHCKRCHKRKDSEDRVGVLIENGVFVRALHGSERAGSLVFRELVLPEEVFDNEPLLEFLAVVLCEEGGNTAGLGHDRVE